MNDLNMNRLPVPTWNQCGVNSAPKAAALPAVPADNWGEVNLAFTLPAGVGEAEEDFTTFAESGMGAETDAFLLGNANVRSALTVAEGVEVNDPVQFEVTLDAAHPTALSVFSLDAKAHSSVTLVQVVRGDAENGVAASLTRIRTGGCPCQTGTDSAAGQQGPPLERRGRGRGPRCQSGAGACGAGRKSFRLRHPRHAGHSQK